MALFLGRKTDGQKRAPLYWFTIKIAHSGRNWAEAGNPIQISQVDVRDLVTGAIAAVSLGLCRWEAGVERQSQESNPGNPLQNAGISDTRLNVHS